MPQCACVQTPRYESDLVEHFLSCLTSRSSPWKYTGHIEEFDYSTGRTDVVSKTDEGQLIAFEAKLTRWRDAVVQAYRNKAFAHTSYVLMPYVEALRSAQYGAEFKKYGVGLCTLREGKIEVLILANSDEPLLKWLANKAQKQLAASY